MKVRELQEKLSKLDPESNVVCCTEDEKFLRPGVTAFLLFEIQSVDMAKGERMRLEDGTPYLNLDKKATSAPIVLLSVTSDF